MAVDVQATAVEQVFLSAWEFQLWLRDGAGAWQQHLEAEPTWEQGVRGGTIAPNEPGSRYDFAVPVHLQHLGGYFANLRFAFEKPGTYLLVVTYDKLREHRKPPGAAEATSNTIELRVLAPPAPDDQVFAEDLRSQPGLLSKEFAPIVDPEGDTRRRLLARYPRSIYADLWR